MFFSSQFLSGSECACVLTYNHLDGSYSASVHCLIAVVEDLIQRDKIFPPDLQSSIRLASAHLQFIYGITKGRDLSTKIIHKLYRSKLLSLCRSSLFFAQHKPQHKSVLCLDPLGELIALPKPPRRIKG